MVEYNVDLDQYLIFPHKSLMQMPYLYTSVLKLYSSFILACHSASYHSKLDMFMSQTTWQNSALTKERLIVEDHSAIGTLQTRKFKTIIHFTDFAGYKKITTAFLT